MNACPQERGNRRRIELLMMSGLSHGEHERLRGHLRGCLPCRAHYDRARRAEDALCGAELSVSAIERMADLVVGPQASVQRGRSWLAIFALGLAATAALMLSLGAEPEFAPRGNLNAPEPAALGVFRVSPSEQRVERLRRGEAPISIRIDDVIQFVYRNERFAYAVLVGLDAEGGVQWYHPRDAGSPAVPLVAAAIDEPFGNAWSMKAAPGPLRVFALFSARPLAREQVDAALRRAAAAGSSLAALERLEGVEAFQDSLLFEVTP